jgi:hypothetical protein
LTPSADPFSRTITVGSGDTDSIEIPMVLPVLTVAGRIADMDTAVLRVPQFLEVQLRPLEQRARSVSSRVTPDGSFAFSTVQPGDYVVAILRCTRGSFDDTCSAGRAQPIKVDKDIRDLSIFLASSGLPGIR